MFFLFCLLSVPGSAYLRSQCPSSGETKVFNSKSGAGFYFYKFLGDSSFRYFLDGKTFSLDDKRDPGKTFLFIDQMVYEPLLLENSQLKEYTKSSKDIDILRAQAKYEQEYFKNADPSMLITDYGPAYQKNSDGSDGRLFYLWKKESAPGKTAATQYLCSTMIKERLFVMSFMSQEGSISEDDMMGQIQTYTSHFASLSSSQCAQVLAAPSTP
jgi:hypothetical protein